MGFPSSGDYSDCILSFTVVEIQDAFEVRSPETSLRQVQPKLCKDEGKLWTFSGFVHLFSLNIGPTSVPDLSNGTNLT